MPSQTKGTGIDVGDTRNVHFTYHKHIIGNTHEGNLELTVSDRTENSITFIKTHDNSYISNYLDWQISHVTVEPISDTESKVSWTLEYKRLLDPIWYFGPLQHYATKLTASTLIDYVADPNS